MTKKEILKLFKQYKTKNSKQYNIERLGIFGSLARDEKHDKSDIDICIKTSSPNPFNLVHIKEDLEKILHSHVDIVRLREKMNPFLKKRIETDCIYV